METIFDFNPTKDDLFDILSDPNADAEWYRKSFSPGAFVMHLCFLFHRRGQKKLLKHYLNKMTESSQFDFYRTVTHNKGIEIISDS